MSSKSRSISTEQLCNELKTLHEELTDGPEHQKELSTDQPKTDIPKPQQPDLLDQDCIDD